MFTLEIDVMSVLTSRPQITPKNLVDQGGGLCLSVQSVNRREHYSSDPIRQTHGFCSDLITVVVLLGISIQTSFLHGVNGVTQKLMGILLTPKPKMASNF